MKIIFVAFGGSDFLDSLFVGFKVLSDVAALTLTMSVMLVFCMPTGHLFCLFRLTQQDRGLLQDQFWVNFAISRFKLQSFEIWKLSFSLVLVNSFIVPFFWNFLEQNKSIDNVLCVDLKIEVELFEMHDFSSFRNFSSYWRISSLFFSWCKSPSHVGELRDGIRKKANLLILDRCNLLTRVHDS